MITFNNARKDSNGLDIKKDIAQGSPQKLRTFHHIGTTGEDQLNQTGKNNINLNFAH